MTYRNTVSGRLSSAYGYTVLALMLVLSTACSGLKPYRTHNNDNLVILTDTDSRSFFSGLHTSVDIHHVDPACRKEYQGTIKLDQARLATGIDIETPVLLVFVFESSNWLAGSDNMITYDTLLNARPGYRYEAQVSYRDDFYDVTLTASPPQDTRVESMQRMPLSACKISMKQGHLQASR